MPDGDVRESLRRAYDAKAAERAVMDDQPWKQPERKRFGKLLRTEGLVSLLEIGAGHGVSGRYFADEGFDVLCTDLSPALVECCRAQGLPAQVMDFTRLTFSPASFDAVFGMNCLLHVPRAELRTVLQSVRSVLKPSGLFYWGQYSLPEPFEGIHRDDTYEPKRFFSFLADEEILRLAAVTFQVLDFRRIALDERGLWGYQALVLRRQAD